MNSAHVGAVIFVDLVLQPYHSLPRSALAVVQFSFQTDLRGGYRYLDSCGEFIIQAINTLDFVPGEAQVMGAKLEKPELGIKATVDSNELTLIQEQPTDGERIF